MRISSNSPHLPLLPQRTWLRQALSTALLSAFLAVSQVELQAQTLYYWDTNGATPGVGGIGNWTFTDTNFSTSALGDLPTVAWDNTAAPPNNVIFATSGTVNMTTTANSTTAYNFGTATFTANYSFFTNNVAANSIVQLNGDVVLNSGVQVTIFRNGAVSNNWTLAAGNISGGELRLHQSNTGLNRLLISGAVSSNITNLTSSTGGSVGLIGTSSNATISGTVATSSTSNIVIGANTGSSLTLSGNLTGSKPILISTSLDTTATTGGTVRLNFATGSTYNGTITVQGGTLEVNGAYNSANVTVRNLSSNATGSQVLAGTGTVRSIVLNSNGAIAPGNSSLTIATLSTNNGNFTWNGDTGSFSQMKFDLSTVNNTSDRLSLGTGVFTKGTSGLFRFDFLGTGKADETYTLLTFGSHTGGWSVSDFSYTNLGSGLSGSFLLNSDSLQFNVIPEPQAYLLVGMGLAFLFWRRRFRQPSA